MASESVSEQAVASRVWSRSADDDLLRERSHWRGSGRYADDAVWTQIGLRSRREISLLLRLLGEPPLAPDKRLKVLEWGPGGGSNVVALAPFSQRYVGVDISSANLAECGAQARRAGLSTFVGHLLQDDPVTEMRSYRREFDIIVSTAVFQHFPSKHYGIEVLKAMFESSADGAVGMIQIRYDDADPRFVPKENDYESNYLTATSYTLPEFWRHLEDVGFQPVAIRSVRPDINYATYLFKKARP